MSYEPGIRHRLHKGGDMGISMVSVASDLAFGFMHDTYRR